jgi:hypothetical protein
MVNILLSLSTYPPVFKVLSMTTNDLLMDQMALQALIEETKALGWDKPDKLVAIRIHW